MKHPASVSDLPKDFSNLWEHDLSIYSATAFLSILDYLNYLLDNNYATLEEPNHIIKTVWIDNSMISDKTESFIIDFIFSQLGEEESSMGSYYGHNQLDNESSKIVAKFVEGKIDRNHYYNIKAQRRDDELYLFYKKNKSGSSFDKSTIKTMIRYEIVLDETYSSQVVDFTNMKELKLDSIENNDRG